MKKPLKLKIKENTNFLRVNLINIFFIYKKSLFLKNLLNK